MIPIIGHSGKGTAMVAIKWSMVAGGWEGRGRKSRAPRSLGTVKILPTQWWVQVVTDLSKLRGEWPCVPWTWVTVMCQRVSTGCNTIPLKGRRLLIGEAVHVRGQGPEGKSLCLPLHCVMNLKLFEKDEAFKKQFNKQPHVPPSAG